MAEGNTTTAAWEEETGKRVVPGVPGRMNVAKLAAEQGIVTVLEEVAGRGFEGKRTGNGTERWVTTLVPRSLTAEEGTAAEAVRRVGLEAVVRLWDSSKRQTVAQK